MQEIFDINKLPDRRLGIRTTVALDRVPAEDATQIIKRKMALQLATKILEGKPFFIERRSIVDGITLVEYLADCIVLTTEEFATLKREAFAQGVQRTRGFTTHF
jgi:hypothetical protein